MNSAQKQKLKRDLLMMGYDDDEDYENDGEEIVAAVNGDATAHLTEEELKIQMYAQAQLQRQMQ